MYPAIWGKDRGNWFGESYKPKYYYIKGVFMVTTHDFHELFKESLLSLLIVTHFYDYLFLNYMNKYCVETCVLVLADCKSSYHIIFGCCVYKPFYVLCIRHTKWLIMPPSFNEHNIGQALQFVSIYACFIL